MVGKEELQGLVNELIVAYKYELCLYFALCTGGRNHG